ncbi:ferredoxin FdxA [Burkholderia cepacia]|uniref:ferredoxin FdxA n=1 Tax=Burkholderia cepacia TaxID=292 RepID=UPI002AB6EB22|nr:ferredoxin FdxA [Burkholderia cepacia]
MAHVVTESCIRCKYTDCLQVCPVDCFHEGPNFLVIDPAACIDCAFCATQCPTKAIYAASDLPESQRDFIEINARMAQEWPIITVTKNPLADADEWVNKIEKRQFLEL